MRKEALRNPINAIVEVPSWLLHLYEVSNLTIKMGVPFLGLYQRLRRMRRRVLLSLSSSLRGRLDGRRRAMVYANDNVDGANGWWGAFAVF